jgi:hypothetical protein
MTYHLFSIPFVRSACKVHTGSMTFAMRSEFTGDLCGIGRQGMQPASKTQRALL